MRPNRPLAATLIALAVGSAVIGQRPMLHYHFNRDSSGGSTPGFVDNAGTLMPGPSPMAGFQLTGTSPNGTSCLQGNGAVGPVGVVTTPLALTSGNASWSIGFAVKSSPLPPFDAEYVTTEASA